MNNQTFQFRQIQFRNIGWRGRIGLVVAAALAIAVTIALVILSIGLALILVPVVALVMLYARWRLGKLQAKADADASARDALRQGRVIETDYAVIDRTTDRDLR